MSLSIAVATGHNARRRECVRGEARAASTAYSALAGRLTIDHGIPEFRGTLSYRQCILQTEHCAVALACAGEAAPARGIICDRVLDTRARWLRGRLTLRILYAALAPVATEARSPRKAVRVITAA